MTCDCETCKVIAQTKKENEVVKINMFVKLMIMLSLATMVSCSWFPRHYINRHNNIVRICKLPLFYVLENIEDEHVKPIIFAADYWNGILPQQTFIFGGKFKEGEIEPSKHVMVIRRLDSLISDGSCGEAGVESIRNGCVNKPFINLKTGCLDGLGDVLKIETLIRHELGHIVGLDDSDNPMHLMYGEVLFKRKPYMITPIGKLVDATESEIEKANELY